MEITAANLRELHRIHRQLADLRERVDRGPKQVRAHAAAVKKLEEDRAAVKDTTKTCRMKVDQKQVDLKAGETKIEEWRVKLNGCSSNKEYQALTEQIRAAEMANSVLADEILEGMEKIDELEAEVGEAEKQVAAAQSDMARVEQEVAREAAGLHSEIERLETDLKAAESALPSDFRADYDRIVQAKGEDALAELDGEHCGGCNQSITANMQNDLYLSRPIFCKNCGRLLYLAEGRSARADG